MMILIQRSSVKLESDGNDHDPEDGNGPDVLQRFGQSVSLEEYPPYKSEIMGQRENFSQMLRPEGHPFEWKHES